VPWVVRERETLQIRRRVCILLPSVSTAAGEFQLGVQHADDAWSAEPFDEVARHRCRRTRPQGTAPEALRVFSCCRRLCRDELGADPSERTAETLLAILKSKGR
jgi:hypothetical protein